MDWINEKGQGIIQKPFSIPPLSSSTPVYIRVDNTGLKNYNNNKEMPSINLFDEKAKKLCKRKEIGCSFQTDGTQAIIQYIESKIITLRGSRKTAEERTERDVIRMKKLIEWRNEGKEQGKKGRPRFPILKESREIPSDKLFIGEKCVVLFRQ